MPAKKSAYEIIKDALPIVILLGSIAGFGFKFYLQVHDMQRDIKQLKAKVAEHDKIAKRAYLLSATNAKPTRSDKKVAA